MLLEGGVEMQQNVSRGWRWTGQRGRMVLIRDTCRREMHSLQRCLVERTRYRRG
jgi:hypothetical protein